MSLANEDQPQVLQDAGDFLLAWKPPKMSMKRPRGGANSDFEAWAGYKALPPLLGRGIGGLVLLAARDVKLSADLSGEASLAMVVQGEPSEEELRNAEGPLRSLRVLNASEGLHLGRLSLLEGELPARVSEKEVRRFLAEEVGHRIIGNGQLCARAAGVRRTFLARVGLRLPSLGLQLQLDAPRSFRRLMQKDAEALQRRLEDGLTDAAATWGGRTEHRAQSAMFDGLTLHVPPGVFVPRRSALPIVQAAHAAGQGFADGRLLDCGTGSGCIALALLRRLPQTVTAVAIDADPNAVACATRNAKDLNLADRCEVRALRFSELQHLDVAEPQRFSIAVSNPPYLPKRLMEHVGFARELQSQSVHAFAAGEDGLGAYEELAQNLPQATTSGRYNVHIRAKTSEIAEGCCRGCDRSRSRNRSGAEEVGRSC